jgi:hypothetical protein
MDGWLCGYVRWEWYIQNYKQWRNHAVISKYEDSSRTIE